MMETTVAAGIPKERPAAVAAATSASSTASAFVTKSITLQRQHHHQGFGFCLRGGVEHGVGHFVSSVDEGSIAEAQGIVAGDQIICVDGLPLMTATHKEAVAFISIRNKVSSLGILSKYFRPFFNRMSRFIFEFFFFEKDMQTCNF